MRKFFVSIVAILYLGVSTGATVHLHYCMGKFVGSSFSQKGKSDLCSKCGMKKKASKKKCCKDETQLVKIDQDQKITFAQNHHFELLAVEAVISNRLVPAAFITESTLNTVFSNAPPPLISTTPIYLRNCDFRI